MAGQAHVLDLALLADLNAVSHTGHVQGQGKTCVLSRAQPFFAVHFLRVGATHHLKEEHGHVSNLECR